MGRRRRRRSAAATPIDSWLAGAAATAARQPAPVLRDEPGPIQLETFPHSSAFDVAHESLANALNRGYSYLDGVRLPLVAWICGEYPEVRLDVAYSLNEYLLL